jgi:hypothetical protein
MNSMTALKTMTKEKTNPRPLRYLALVGSTGKSHKKLNALLKSTRYYCLLDCYKNIKDLDENKAFYLPDCTIIEIRSVFSLLFMRTKIEKLKDAFPGMKVVLYYNLFRRYPRTEVKNRLHHQLHATDNDETLVYILEAALERKQNSIC